MNFEFESELLWRILGLFAFNTIIMAILIFGMYYPKAKRLDFIFTFFMIGSVVFFLSYLMSKVEVNLGFALGLFAIFGIIRYRTDQIPIKEMTYLFIVIGLSLINAITGEVIIFWETLVANLAMLGLVWAYEKLQSVKKEASRIIIYDKLELLKKGSEATLILDLTETTGLNIYRIEIMKYNLFKKTALIRAFYHPEKNGLVMDVPEGSSNDSDED